ncbi:MAG TPA: ATP-dependent metallopeptidase FtsH/Yme1/Tma family protein, partial [Acidimicrobiales bacterium]|nr:ATP-dependent metallopeptidase FtsH/Yme1/Tma family protein [Acidimicrobiales bacterium]
MSPQRPDATPPRPPAPGNGGSPASSGGGEQNWRWIWVALIVAVLAVLIIPSLLPHSSAKSLSYSQYMSDVSGKKVVTANIDNTSG